MPSFIRFLIPDDFSYQQFMQVIRKRLSLPKTHALYIYFSNNKLHSNGKFPQSVKL